VHPLSFGPARAGSAHISSKPVALDHRSGYVARVGTGVDRAEVRLAELVAARPRGRRSPSPGHAPEAEAGSELVQFSPAKELAEVEAAMMKSMQAGSDG
jgi:hypothetical protein